MKTKTVNLIANALIELDKNGISPLIDTNTLLEYVDVINKKMDADNMITNMDIIDIKMNHSEFIKIINEKGLFGIAKNKTSEDLIIKYRNDISYKLIDAVKSKETYDVLGINAKKINRNSNKVMIRK